MKRLIPLIILAIVCLPGNAQDWYDALRYSQTYAGGTARSTAMGGAFGALGGDFYSVSQNPAGLGVYRSAEITLTPELYYNKSTSRYLGTETEDYKYNFNLNNFGYVASFNKNEKGFIGWSIAFGFNRLNNYHSNIIIEGENTESSLGDLFVSSANYGDGNGPVDPIDLRPFDEGLFYDSWVMDFDTITGSYYLNENIRNTDGTIGNIQRNTLERSGRMNEWVFAAGFNYGHFLYFGATVAIVPFRFEERSNFTELSSASGTNYSFNYYEKLRVSGTGISGKFGIIAKPVSLLRLGVAFHTPVVYSINEVYEANMTSSFVNGIVYPLQIDEYGNEYVMYDASQDYQIVTPYKLIGSAAVTLGNFMIISADCEYIDYTSMRLRKGGDGYDFYEENQGIKEIYRKTINLKAGAEFRLDILYFRGGFDYYGSPYQKDEINFDAHHYMYSAGIGFREKNFILDFAWNYKMFDERYILYNLEGRRPYTTNLDSKISRFMLTLGYKF
ncbi:MAG: outer membrane protein transport protein [Bacteroidales bacterium]|nr:outer membrane protein transport protein [Bacteroidales bacterium]